MEGQCECVSEVVLPRPFKPSPWGHAPGEPLQPPCSLATVMDEELARELQGKEGGVTAVVEAFGSVSDAFPREEAPATPDDDLLLAQMLQLEFDLESDLHLAAQERHVNGDSKVSISYSRYRSVHPVTAQEEENPDPYDLIDDVMEVDRSKGLPPHGAGGKSRRRRSKGGVQQPTKHDPVVCGRRNVESIAEHFPLSFPAGDVADERRYYRVPNPVYNSLKLHARMEEHRSKRLHDKKEHATHEQALDEKTRLMLFKLVDSGLLEEVNGCISTGKEACVYHARGGCADDRILPTEVAIKVFKTTLVEFKTRDKYIKDDYRFKQRFSKQNPRKVIHMWAEKEYHNLRRLNDGGVACPKVVMLKKHVLVMEFIGQDGRPAPKLTEVVLSPEDLRLAYHQCVEGMKRMYHDCHLVHSDLSAFNLLWHEGQVHFIDVSQSVEPTHPHGLEFLLRDCTNVTNFFNKKGLGEVPSPRQLFSDITGHSITVDNDEELLIQAKSYQKERQVMEHVKEHPEDSGFDYYFGLTTTANGDPSDSSDSEGDSN